jgi:peptidoglycan/LPS O-acetylase OafA/YrhL
MTDLSVAATPSLPRSAEVPSAHIRYRAYIDGLRAVAVMPVVLYHAGFTTFSGGFIGVDVFFVISGFLITSLIMSDLEAGKFSILGFYERRIRRIFPALFAVFGACSITAWFVFMPEEFAYFARSVIAAALFGSNILFWDESGYFDTAAQLKPLLHTWSLAVEEQFYIFFPLVLMLLHKIWRTRLVTVLLILAVLSFGLNLWATEHRPEFAFFMSPTRFWELLLGALLATGLIPNIESRLANQLLATLGLGLIAISVFAYSGAMNYPGVAALLPCVGAALILLSGHQDGPVNRILSARPIVFLGLISYSLYLWHWPIIVFVRYYFGRDPSLSEALLIISASLVISALSWRWIEQPFRRRQKGVPRPILFGSAASAMAAALVFGLIINASDGAPGRLPAAVIAVYSAKQDVRTSYQPQCKDEGEVDQVCPYYLLGNRTDGPPRFIVWGDSHAGSMSPAIEEAAIAGRQSGFLVGRPSCPPLLNFDTGGERVEKKVLCERKNHAVMRLIRDQGISLVLMVARWPKYVHHAEYGNEGVFFDPSQPVSLDDYSAAMQTALDAMLAELTRNNVRVVLVMDVPEMGLDVPHALAKAVLTRSTGDIAPSREAVRRRQALAMKVLSASASKYGVPLIDPTPDICDEERCFASRNGHVLYKDEDHLTFSAAKSMSHIFNSVFAK